VALPDATLTGLLARWLRDGCRKNGTTAGNPKTAMKFSALALDGFPQPVGASNLRGSSAEGVR
jgi:hypothetical protein